ncbi:helix-turn-helix domain-containing protein [Micavibrio aeruginosavorus]|uniref:helix-turn-helix domain-containing protein n=1 Tax=Micavibrio aeruginosavorus TaxID=349221 RepID=UPI003F4AD061
MWTSIRTLKRFTLKELCQHSGISASTARGFLKPLMAGGFIKARKDGGPVVYQLMKDNGAHRPDITNDGKKKKPDGMQRMWAAMKVLKNFRISDLTLAAETVEQEAKHYCLYLTRAGYLRSVGDVYKFVQKNDTGPHAPRVMIARAFKVYDRNTGMVVWPESEAA